MKDRKCDSLLSGDLEVGYTGAPYFSVAVLYFTVVWISLLKCLNKFEDIGTTPSRRIRSMGYNAKWFN